MTFSTTIELATSTWAILKELQRSLEKRWMLLSCNKCCKEHQETEENSQEKISTALWPKRPSDNDCLLCLLIITIFLFLTLGFYFCPIVSFSNTCLMFLESIVKSCLGLKISFWTLKNKDMTVYLMDQGLYKDKTSYWANGW